MEDFPFGSDQPWNSFKQQITSVVIHPGVTSIGECAFSWFPKLTHVDIADSVISIGGNAFKSCSSLTDITIPQRVTHIGGLAFSRCTSLSSITLSNNITSIGNAAFKNCTNLTSITIPSSVISIGSNVFDGCTRLNDIRYSGTSENVISALSQYVTRVTFNYGDKVPEAERMITVSIKTGETLTAPTTHPNVVGYEFKGWLTEDGKPYDFTVPPTGQFTLYAKWEKISDPKPDPDPPKSGKCGAAGDGSDVTWHLTENTDDPSTYTLTISGSGAMENYLTSGHQPWHSFRDQITSVVVSPGVTSIGNLAFALSRNIIHVDIADSVVSIGEQVFFKCASLTNITVPQSVTYIGVNAFDSCTNLSSITLSTNNITSIRPYTFSGCSKLSSIVIPDGVTSIQLGAFSNCTKLTSISIPGSVISIGPYAFRDCTNLTSITIPGSVTSIGEHVFTGCTSLNDIRYSGTSESVISALSGYVLTLVTFNYGDKVPEAERMITVSVKTGETLTAPTTPPTVSGYEFKGWLTEDDKPYDFTVAPTGKFTLYANWEKIPEPKPDPKPEPKPKPEPEAPTYTLTVKGGTFTYNGNEAMTSASVPVDAEVKVTLNQSAVPEGMVFDLWAMDEASLLGNPAVAYNEESFTIPAGSVAKDSTVTVEAQYRDATIESEPSVLGTAAIIGVAGAGTAVIVWQGYRIGMELYEKYFQPTPEETAAEQPAPEAPAAAAAS
ncbi:leucine-rich repeat protein [Faecalibacterium duncaniae]|uniref:leucine-rich repeat protein n=1 Tax=Faecalibacterium duncaniae (strain DSM 17677 / JCM 31915 / A2-165) TaxID=411483 RepID=UPI003D748C7B